MATNFYTELNVNGNNITGLPSNPSGDTSAASKAYVDSVAKGLDPKASVKTATVGILASLSGEISVGSVALVAGDRVLVKNQTNTSENGIYDVKAGAWTRSTDATVGTDATLSVGAFTFVEGGDNGGKGFVYTAAGTWEQFSDTGALSAGAGISTASNQISVVAKEGGNITVDSDGVDVTGQIPVAKGGTGAETLTGYVIGNGTSAFTSSSSIPAEDVTGRRLVGTVTIGTGITATPINTTALNSTLRDSAIVQLFDNSGNQVFADITVGANAVTINANNTTGSAITLKYIIAV